MKFYAYLTACFLMVASCFAYAGYAMAEDAPAIQSDTQYPQSVMQVIADANKAGVKVIVLTGDRLAAFNAVTKAKLGAVGDIPAGTTIMVIVDPTDTNFTMDMLPVMVFSADGTLTGKGQFDRDVTTKGLAAQADPGT